MPITPRLPGPNPNPTGTPTPLPPVNVPVPVPGLTSPTPNPNPTGTPTPLPPVNVPVPVPVPGLTSPTPTPTPTPTANPTQAPLPLPSPAFTRAGAGPAARALLQEAIDNKRDPHETLIALANGPGLPLDFGKTVLFVREATGPQPATLIGDHNGWQPLPMKRMGNFDVLEVLASNVNRYKFKTPEGDQPDPLARAYAYDDKGEMSLARTSVSHFIRFSEMKAEGLPPRTVRVWIPAQKPTHQLYVHDGQNLFGPGAPNGGWQLDKQAGPNTLVIGIDNTFARFEELTPWQDDIKVTDGSPVETHGGKADSLCDMIEQKLMPLIEATFGAPAKRGVMGSSLGGMMSMYQASRGKVTYDFVASLSGTLHWGSIGRQGPTLFDTYAKIPPSSQLVYLYSGGGPSADPKDNRDNFNHAIRMRDQLQSQGYVYGEQVMHYWKPDAPHSESAWRDEVSKPLGAFQAL